MENDKIPAEVIKNPAELALTDLERKERKVVELKQMGVTFDVIAKEVGYANASGAWHAYNRYMEKYKSVPVESQYELQETRIERLLAGVWTKALRGEIPAVMAAVKLLERQAKLFGLDAPDKSVSIGINLDGDGELDEQVKRFAYLIAQAREDHESGHSSGGSYVMGSDSATESDSTGDGLAELADSVGSRMGQDAVRGGMDSERSPQQEENALGDHSEDSR